CSCFICIFINVYCCGILLFFFFFFQAEDGIRDDLVTGVQTCALPISSIRPTSALAGSTAVTLTNINGAHFTPASQVQWDGVANRSEERRVGKECRTRGWT